MSLLRRALAGATATLALSGALVAGIAAPAAAESSSFCPHDPSTRVFTANEGQYKLWVYRDVSSRYHVCYAASPDVAGDLVIDSGISGSVIPTVNWTLADPNCPDLFTVQDPIDVVTEFGNGLPWSVCFGVTDNAAIKVSVAGPTVSVWPSVELWVDRYTTVGREYCDTVNDWQCYYGYDAIRVV